MRACVLRAIKAPLEIEERPALVPGDNEVVVALKAAALNRRDYWITQGMYPGIDPPVVLGSDGAGVVVRAGDDAGKDWLNREVIINPGLNWGPSEAAQSDSFTILGLPQDGTFASEVCVSVSQLRKKPSHLSGTQAAALPLAGTTAWRAMFTQGRLQRGRKVLITGIGGGVAAFALQFAVAAGANVWVTSSSSAKIDRAVNMGACGGVLYTDTDWPKQLIAEAGAPELIVDSAGGSSYQSLIRIAAPGARIVNYGSTTGAPDQLDLFKVFWKQLHLIGSTMGSPADFSAMVDFVEEQSIAPIIDEVLPLDDVNAAINRMGSSPQFGKIVLEMS